MFENITWIMFRLSPSDIDDEKICLNLYLRIYLDIYEATHIRLSASWLVVWLADLLGCLSVAWLAVDWLNGWHNRSYKYQIVYDQSPVKLNISNFQTNHIFQTKVPANHADT